MSRQSWRKTLLANIKHLDLVYYASFMYVALVALVHLTVREDRGRVFRTDR